MLVMVGDAVCLNEQTDSMSDVYDCALLQQESKLTTGSM